MARLPAPSEAELQQVLVDAATVRGYLVHHVRPARTSKGYRTPLQGHPGFPDLVIAGRGALFVWELKTDTGRLAREQVVWLQRLTDALDPDVADVRVVTPSLLDDALRALELGRWPERPTR